MNSLRARGLPEPEQLSHAQPEELIPARLRPEGATPEDLRKLLIDVSNGFRDSAPVSAAQAAGIILDEVQTEDLADPHRRRRPAHRHLRPHQARRRLRL